MKSLIVGGNSSVGQALKPALLELGPVLTAGRTRCDIGLDLGTPMDGLQLPEDVDVLIHTAAHFGGAGDEDLLAAEDINVLGTLRLCQAAQRAGVEHFILISTIFARLEEGAPQYGIYALSKKHAEDVARLYCKARALPLTILRPSQIYGDGDGFRRHQPFFYTIIDQAEQGKDVTLYGSNDPRRNYIHVNDVAKVIATVATRKVLGTYSCAHPQDVSYSQIARAAFAAFKRGGSVDFLRSRPDTPDNVFGHDNSLYEAIGFHPGITIEAGIARIARERASRR